MGHWIVVVSMELLVWRIGTFDFINYNLIVLFRVTRQCLRRVCPASTNLKRRLCRRHWPPSRPHRLEVYRRGEPNLAGQSRACCLHSAVIVGVYLLQCSAHTRISKQQPRISVQQCMDGWDLRVSIHSCAYISEHRFVYLLIANIYSFLEKVLLFHTG